MKRYLNVLVLVLSLHFGLADAHAAAPSDSWTDDEMNPLPKAQSTNDKQIKDISCGTGCKFDLHYFKDKNVPGGKNILFISGGPGQITKRVLKPGEDRFLEFLEDKYNVFYFDIRGAGFSKIDKANKFDTALRAAYVVEDIDRIRKAELGESVAWDAVYGHSHGTIVAQRYAKTSPSGNPRLKKLILSAPLSRLEDFEKARIEMLVNNLKSIFENYRQQTAGQSCPPGAPPTSGINGTDNFCFLSTGSDGMVDKLVSKFKEKLTALSEEFGSVHFVAEYFKEILKEEKDRVTFPSKFPYPKDFYLALKSLSLFGGTEPHPLKAADKVRQARVNAAFLLGYFLAFDETKDFKPGELLFPATQTCLREAPFLDGVTHRVGSNEWKEAFCERYLEAFNTLVHVEEMVPDSKRANTVFGLNDGINRSIFSILKVKPSQSGCIDSRVVKEFSNDTDKDTHKAARAVARRVGIDPLELICLWNPEDFAHGIPTLILKGGADPIIGGCQAENVFTKGLTGERVLIDFPGVGHFLQLPTFTANGAETDGQDALFQLVDTFLTKSFKEFNKDTNELRKQLHATTHMATGPGGTVICRH